MKNYKNYFLIFFTLMLFNNKSAFAQIGTLDPPQAVNIDITTTIGTFLQFALGSGVVVFFFLFMWGSIQWLTSEGEKGALAAAKARITSAAIGLILLASVWAIFELVKGITYSP